MIKFIIIEDSKEYQNNIKKIINNCLFKSSTDYVFNCYEKYNLDLEKEINNFEDHKVYIIDIELCNSINGIDIAKKIRKNDWQSEIIFLTSHDKMFDTVYRNIYEVFDFIEKYLNMEKRLEKAINMILNKNFDNDMFVYTNKYIKIKIYYKAILFIYRDTVERKCIIVTDNNKFKISLSLNEIIEQLDQRFKYSYRSCIINVNRVNKYDFKNNIIVFDNGKKIDMLSKKYKKELINEH